MAPLTKRQLIPKGHCATFDDLRDTILEQTSKKSLQGLILDDFDDTGHLGERTMAEEVLDHNTRLETTLTLQTSFFPGMEPCLSWVLETPSVQFISKLHLFGIRLRHLADVRQLLKLLESSLEELKIGWLSDMDISEKDLNDHFKGLLTNHSKISSLYLCIQDLRPSRARWVSSFLEHSGFLRWTSSFTQVAFELSPVLLDELEENMETFDKIDRLLEPWVIGYASEDPKDTVLLGNICSLIFHLKCGVVTFQDAATLLSKRFWHLGEGAATMSVGFNDLNHESQ